MTYHFAGAKLFLAAENVFQIFDDGFCLTIMPIRDGGVNLLGEFQQVNYRFLFDIGALRASFVQEVCELT